MRFGFILLLTLAACATKTKTSEPNTPPSSTQEMSAAEKYPIEQKDNIRNVIREHMREVRLCYEKALKTDAKAEGKTVFAWDIDATGAARNIVLVEESSSLKNATLTECMGKQIASWKFPNAPSDELANIRYPFSFTPDKEQKAKSHKKNKEN